MYKFGTVDRGPAANSRFPLSLSRCRSSRKERMSDGIGRILLKAEPIAGTSYISPATRDRRWSLFFEEIDPHKPTAPSAAGAKRGGQWPITTCCGGEWSACTCIHADDTLMAYDVLSQTRRPPSDQTGFPSGLFFLG